jgi:hypothetical protein
VELWTIIGLVLGVVGIVSSMAMTTAQGNEARITSSQLFAYLTEMHGQMLTRFDRIDAMSAEIRAAVAQRANDV